MNKELNFIVWSYLSLEEVLIYNDITMRDQIIKRYYKILPRIDDASENGELETVKYLVGLGKNVDKNTLDWGSSGGNLSYY